VLSVDGFSWRLHSISLHDEVFASVNFMEFIGKYLLGEAIRQKLLGLRAFVTKAAA
jgi:hypothetical protein